MLFVVQASCRLFLVTFAYDSLSHIYFSHAGQAFVKCFSVVYLIQDVKTMSSSIDLTRNGNSWTIHETINKIIFNVDWKWHFFI